MVYLQFVHSPAFSPADDRPYFATLAERSNGISRMLERLQQRLRDAYEEHQLHLEETTSSRLRILTVLSAVYLPATLVAGIYGMNFDNIPITQYENGYGAVLVLMVVIVAGQLYYFSKRGWFR